MRPYVRSFPLLLLFMVLLAACAGKPALAVTPGEHDFGDIAADAPVTTTLQVQNSGEGDLRITGVTTSCGCTTAEVASPTLPTGATSTLTVSFDPQAHPGLYGPLLRMVYLQSNDPEQSEVEIPIHLNILSPEEK